MTASGLKFTSKAIDALFARATRVRFPAAEFGKRQYVTQASTESVCQCTGPGWERSDANRCQQRPNFGQGLLGELNPGPLAPEARVIPLDQAAWAVYVFRSFPPNLLGAYSGTFRPINVVLPGGGGSTQPNKNAKTRVRFPTDALSRFRFCIPPSKSEVGASMHNPKGRVVKRAVRE